MVRVNTVSCIMMDRVNFVLAEVKRRTDLCPTIGRTGLNVVLLQKGKK